MLIRAQTAQAADERWYKGNVQQFQRFPGVRDFLSLLKLPIRRFFRQSKSAEVTTGVRLHVCEWHHVRGASRKVIRGGLAAPMVWPVSPVSEGGRQSVFQPASAGGRVFGLAIKQT